MNQKIYKYKKWISKPFDQRFPIFKTMKGSKEMRYLSQVKVTSSILTNILNTTTGFNNQSFNLMMMTLDHKVLLLQRTQSFHFPKVVRDLKFNKINLDLLGSLYSTEAEKIRKLFFDFFPPLISKQKESIIHIFPGGHSDHNEMIFQTLLRELYEETTIDIKFNELRFHQSCIFKVLIYDLIVKKSFINFIFPVKVNMTSQDICKNFKETKHTRHPTFIDIHGCSLIDAFVKVQEFMLL